MIVAYLRVSTSKQVLANQKCEIEKFAQARGITIDKWVTEVISGKKKASQRRFGRTLQQLKQGDTLIVTEVSRLSRSLTDIMSIMGRCIEKGVVLHCVKEGYTFDDSINSKVLCFAFGLVAEIERNLISMRTKEALAARKAEGRILGRRCGSCPKKALLREERDEIIKDLDGGCSIASLCRRYKVSRGTFNNFAKSDTAVKSAIASYHAMKIRRKTKSISFLQRN